MIQRCCDHGHDNYRLYGARGVQVCDRWKSFENFLADMGERPVGMTIDRKDSAGNYEPGNCGWATALDQANNKRTNIMIEVDGEQKTLAEWCELNGIAYSCAHKRIKQLGWSPDAAVTTKSRKGDHHAIR
jgi:hypothetical protein